MILKCRCVYDGREDERECVCLAATQSGDIYIIFFSLFNFCRHVLVFVIARLLHFRRKVKL